MDRRTQRWTRAALGAVLAAPAAAAIAVPGTAIGAQDDLVLVSRTAAGAAADGSSEPSVSADGRAVAFASFFDGLSGDDDDTYGNIHVRDLGTGATTLVSRASGASGAGADGESFAPHVSADARVVLFTSEAGNLAPGDADGYADVFARDLHTGTTTLVSRATGTAGPRGDDASVGWGLSADGRVAVFTSDADNLSAEDDDGVRGVFARDLVAGTTTLVSRASGAAGAGADDASFAPSVSADGRLVAFDSRADNLSADNDDDAVDVYVRDLAAGTTALVSRAPAAPADGDSFRPAISADGRVVAFSSWARNLSDADADPLIDVFAHELATGATALVSRAPGQSGAGAGAAALFPQISGDGRRVAFQSIAENLSGADATGVADVFVRDLAAGTTTLASRASGPMGAGGDDDSGNPALSADGRFVAFDSTADNLAPETNQFGAVFLRDLGLPPPTAPPPAALAPGLAAAAPGTAPRTVRCAGRRATIVGTPRRDVIRGTRRADVIVALGGNDVVRGLAGADVICLGAGADRAFGGPGRDRVLGGPGRDRILGGAGRDALIGGPGRDLVRPR